MSRNALAPVAVLRGGAVGDFVMTLPAIAALGAACAGSPLWIVGHRQRAALARPDRIVDADGPELLPLYTPARPGARPSALRGVGLTLAYLTEGGDEVSARLEQLTGGEVWWADPRPPAGCEGHVVDHLLTPLRERGVPVPDAMPRIEVGPADLAYAGSLLGGGPERPLVCLHPGSGGLDKCWPLPRYAELGRALLKRGWRCVAILGPAEEERALGSGPGPDSGLPPGVEVARPPDLLSLAGLLSRADLLVGNDSGPGHLAAAAGTPVLSLFGPTEPQLWAPRGERCRVLRAPQNDLLRLELEPVYRAAVAALEAGTNA